MSTKAAIWARVSTDRQHEDNQIPDLERLCDHRGWEIARRYEIADASAYTRASTATRSSECSTMRTAASSPCSLSGPWTDPAGRHRGAAAADRVGVVAVALGGARSFQRVVAVLFGLLGKGKGPHVLAT